MVSGTHSAMETVLALFIRVFFLLLPFALCHLPEM
jgi:hypothetical protein